jgi:hypothetical protein
MNQKALILTEAENLSNHLGIAPFASAFFMNRGMSSESWSHP